MGVAESEPVYGAFVSRVLARFIDGLVLFPLLTLSIWGRTRGPGLALGLALIYAVAVIAYRVGFTAHTGATPGKRALGLRVVRLNGDPVSWREALVRDSVDITLSVASWITIAVVLAGVDPAHYASVGYTAVVREASSLPRDAITTAVVAWGVIDLAVLWFDSRTRAVHDYIAGTVVTRSGPTA